MSLTPRVVKCESYSTVDVPLVDLLDADGALNLYPEIRDGDYFTVKLLKGVLSFQARGYIGQIPVNDTLIVDVESRVPVGNLEHIVATSGEPMTLLRTLRRYQADRRLNASMLDVYADALLAGLTLIRQGGMMREYQRSEEASSFPKGRVLGSATTLRLRSRGVQHAAVSAWFERTTDTPANQCVKYAINMLASRYARLTPPGDRAERRRFRHRQMSLNAAFLDFEGISMRSPRYFLEDATVSGARPLPALRAYYEDALAVARMLARQEGVSMDAVAGEVRLPAIVINMNVVFEAYVRTVMRERAIVDGWEVEVLDGNRSPGKRPLFVGGLGGPAATPDIVVRDLDGKPQLVLEVKNVPVLGLHSKRDHIEQAVTYANAFNVHTVVLVHPCARWQQPGLMDLGLIGDIRVLQYRVDLAANDVSAMEVKLGADLLGLTVPRGESASRW